MEARSLDISIPFVINSTPLNTFGTNFQSQTYICGTPAVFRDRIKLLWLEQLSGYVREGSQVNGPNSSFGKPIGFWSSNLRCYVDISQQATTLTSSGDSLANQQQQQPKCLYPLGTYFTHCGSNDLLPLLPIRPMFFYLNQIESIRSDAFLLVLQQKKMLRLAIELESIVLSYASVYSKEVLSSKLSLSMMEMRSLQVFFNEIARRLRENILSYLPQFELFYDLDKSSSTSYQLMSITIQNGVEKATQQFENMGSGTNATRYLSPSSGSDQTWSNLYELIHFSLLQEGISEDANMELAMSFSSMAQFVDTQIQIIDELFKLINDTLSLDKVIDLSLYTNSPVYDFIDSHSKVLSLTEVDTFSYLRQFIGLDRNFAQESLSKTPSISIDFSSQIFTMIQTTSYMSKVSFKATPPSSYSLINGYLMGDVSNSKILVTDITKQARVLDLVALSGNSQWMVDSSLETDYKPFLKKIPSVTSTTSTTGTRSIITSASLQSTQRTISTPRRRPLSNSVQSYSSITTNHFKLMSFLHEKRRLQTFAPNRRSLLALTSLPTYNCEKGRYGPQCKICYPGTYSPGDGLLYVCSNGPDGQVEYTESGSTNENCAFRCKDTKKYRSGNQCVNIPVRYYSVDNGATTLSECSKNGNSYGITDPSIQQDLLQIATSGQHAFPSSCKTALRDLLSLTFNQTSMFDTTTLTTNSSFSLSHSFTLSIDFKLTPKEKWNFKLKDYQVAYGIVTVPGEWTWQLIFDSPDSIYMQVKKLNPVKNEPRLLSLSFPYDTEWHNFILQYDEEKHVLSLYRDRAYIGSCLFALSQQQEFRLVIGGFFYFNATHTPSLYSYLPASGISNLRIYQGAIMDDLLLSSMKTSSSQWPLWLNSWCESTPGYALFGGKCIRVSCENDDMIYDSSSQQCICSYGYFSSNVSNVTPSCTACPFMTTTGSFLPRTSMKDCQCMHDYIYSEYYQECVMAQSSLLPPTPNFNFGQSYGPYKELEESILSQHFYPVGEMTITLELNEEDDIELIDPQDPSLNLPQKVYQVKLLANGTQLLWSLQLSKNQLLSFSYTCNQTGDFDLILSTERDGHRPGILSRTSFHIRERDLKPLILPKPTDGIFDSPFQVRLQQPYRNKPSVIIMCYGREEFNMTCLEYDEKQLYLFGPPVYLKVLSYGPFFTRLPGEVLSLFYKRTITEAQQRYMDNQQKWNDYLIKKQQAMKELEEKKKASPIYQMVNPFIEWIQVYPNYLWFPIVCVIGLFMYLIFLLALRFCVARYVQKKRKEKIKLYLKEKKEIKEKLKAFLPPKFREEMTSDEDNDNHDGQDMSRNNNPQQRTLSCKPKDSKSSHSSESDQDTEEDDDHSLERKKFIKTPKNKDHTNSPIIGRNTPGSMERTFSRDHDSQQAITTTNRNNINTPKSRPLPNPRSYNSPSTRFQSSSLNQIQINIQDIGASSQRSIPSSPIASNYRKKPLPNPLISKHFSTAPTPKGGNTSHSNVSLIKDNNAPQNDENDSNHRRDEIAHTSNQSRSNSQKSSSKTNPPLLPKRPKYLVCGKCGAMARVWCHSCDNYLCIDCDQQDDRSHSERSKSKVMICDHCMQPRSELKEHFLKGSSFKLFGCKMCMEELYKERKVNRVGSIIKRCTKCMDEEISRTNPQTKLCDNCIYFSYCIFHHHVPLELVYS